MHGQGQNAQTEPECSLGAQALLSRFSVHGRYYSRKIAGIDEQLRDRLEIAPIDWTLQKILSHAPDLLVVMMNPGASRPLNALWDEGSSQGFTAAQPDRTQYQVMRLMLAANRCGVPWHHARILNLSDLRTPKSAEMLHKLAAYQADDSHSIFSKSRSEECSQHFAVQTTPVLCGWGLSKAFTPIARSAIRAMEHHPVLGITADGVLYRHPLPQRHAMQVEWLKHIIQQVKRNFAQKNIN